MFGNLFNPKEQRTQLHFRDDGAFRFRKLDIEEASFVEKDKDVIKIGWPLFYKTQIPFNGHPGIGTADMVTISFDRDIVLDPWGLIEPEEKPEKGDSLVKEWIRKKAESMRYKKANKPLQSVLLEKITIYLGIALLLIVIFTGIKAVT